MDSFGSRLAAAMEARGPLCVGIDPHPELLAKWGLPDDPNGLSAFVQTVIDNLAERVAVLKPQVAFFERFGARGIAVLESAIRQAGAAGALVLLDGKRGDIGSTVAAYADAYLTPGSPLCADAVTANPYLGVGALAPMVAAARAHGRGLFVLARTSNPEAEVCQTARTADGRPVAQLVVDEISQLNEGFSRSGPGPGGFGSFGVVVGATVGDSGLDLSRLDGPILAPGLGAQGARAADLRAVFGADLGRVLPSTSRAVLRAGPDPGELRRAADRALAQCLAVRSAAG